jgi:hypothetical protein
MISIIVRLDGHFPINMLYILLRHLWYHKSMTHSELKKHHIYIVSLITKEKLDFRNFNRFR